MSQASSTEKRYLTARIKVKPESYPYLEKAAEEINQVWNFCRWICAKAYQDQHRWLSAYELMKLVTGSTRGEYGLTHVGQDSINCVAKEYVTRRTQFKKLKLTRRTSKKQGWVPLKPSQLAKKKKKAFTYNGKAIRLFEELPSTALREGAFSQDSLGHWYLCIPYLPKEEPVVTIAPQEACGIDLGLKQVATCSGGETLKMAYYRKAEQKIAQAQRTKHPQQAKFLHRKVKRQRQHALHAYSSTLVATYQNLFIGNVSFAFLKGNAEGSGPKRAKSAYDGSMATLKTQLLYKGRRAGRCVEVIGEAFTTQTCHVCQARTGPRGKAGLAVRVWRCSVCDTEHDRDINAAINIRLLGMKLHPPSAGTRHRTRATVMPVPFAVHGRDSRARTKA